METPVGSDEGSTERLKEDTGEGTEDGYVVEDLEKVIKK